MENNLTTMTTAPTAKHADEAANPSYSPEDAREFTSVIHGLARLSSHQGRPMVNHAVAEAARLPLDSVGAAAQKRFGMVDTVWAVGVKEPRAGPNRERADSITRSE